MLAVLALFEFASCAGAHPVSRSSADRHRLRIRALRCQPLSAVGRGVALPSAAVAIDPRLGFIGRGG